MRTISATEARVHFGELMRSVVENDQPVIVERAGKPEVVVMSVDEYQQRLSAKKEEDWRIALRQARRVGETIRKRRGQQLFPPPEEIIREMREERSEHFLSLLR
ncbi:MAG TPA: type II toxin-antitoxin system Phd/YefM family antitoxin [Caldilineae bacterium]|nr:type II toxin-antitoxin system Phd/YefM family antitoxin [Caldilineae bacterium]